MNCQKCASIRIAEFSAKCKDLGWAKIGDSEKDGYLPYDMGVGGGDYLEISVCLDCGQLQGQWPLPETNLERKGKKSTQVGAWVPDLKYWQYLAELKDVVKANLNNGIIHVIPTLIGDDDDTNRVITGLIELRRDPVTELTAECLIDALDEWDNSEQMYNALAKFWPKEYGDDYNEDEE